MSFVISIKLLKTRSFILNLSSIYLKEDIKWVNKLIDLEFNIYENKEIIKKFWIDKRILRQKKRKVFAGKLKLKNLFKSKNFELISW